VVTAPSDTAWAARRDGEAKKREERETRHRRSALERLQRGPKTPQQLASMLDVAVSAMYPILRQLAERGEAHEVEGVWAAGPGPARAAPKRADPSDVRTRLLELAEDRWAPRMELASRLTGVTLGDAMRAIADLVVAGELVSEARGTRVRRAPQGEGPPGVVVEPDREQGETPNLPVVEDLGDRSSAGHRVVTGGPVETGSVPSPEPTADATPFPSSLMASPEGGLVVVPEASVGDSSIGGDTSSSPDSGATAERGPSQPLGARAPGAVPADVREHGGGSTPSGSALGAVSELVLAELRRHRDGVSVANLAAATGRTSHGLRHVLYDLRDRGLAAWNGRLRRDSRWYPVAPVELPEPPPAPSPFGARVRAAREARGLSQSQLGALVGLTGNNRQVAISAVERGDRACKAGSLREALDRVLFSTEPAPPAAPEAAGEPSIAVPSTSPAVELRSEADHDRVGGDSPEVVQGPAVAGDSVAELETLLDDLDRVADRFESPPPSPAEVRPDYPPPASGGTFRPTAADEAYDAAVLAHARVVELEAELAETRRQLEAERDARALLVADLAEVSESLTAAGIPERAELSWRLGWLECREAVRGSPCSTR
jgi:hypothetical protein